MVERKAVRWPRACCRSCTGFSIFEPQILGKKYYVTQSVVMKTVSDNVQMQLLPSIT